MNYAINIYCGPQDGPVAETALRFCQAVISTGHKIHRLFFFSDGVFNTVAQSPDNGLAHRWQALVKQHSLDAVVCVNSAAERAIYPPDDKRAGLTPLEGFTIAGLGQWVDAAIHADRTLSFGV